MEEKIQEKKEKVKFSELQVEDVFNKRWIPYLWLLLVTSFLHIMGYCVVGDDNNLEPLMRESVWDEITHIPEIIKGWSSRYLINPSIHIMAHFDYRIWMVLNILITMFMYHIVQKYVVKKSTIAYLYIIMNMYLLMPYLSHGDIGWIVYSMTYSWSTAAVLVAFQSIKKSYQTIHIRWYEALLYVVLTLYATTKEELSVMLSIVFGVMLIYAIKNKKAWVVMAIQLVISVFNIFIHLFSTGNASRYERMSRADFIGQHSTIDKLFIGMSATIKHTFLEYNLISLVFFVVLIVAVWVNCKKLVPRLCSMVPVISLCLGDIIIGPFEEYWFVLDFNEYLMIVVGIIDAIAIFTCIMYLYGANDKSLMIITLFIAVFAGRTVVGFGNWGWQEYERTYFYMYFVLAMVSAMLVCDMWDKFNVTIKKLVMTLLVILGMFGTFMNIIYVDII